MKFHLEISDVRITDLLHGHGGSYSMSWLDEISGQWIDGSCTVRFLREDQDEGDEPKGRKRIGSATVRKAMALFAKNSPRHFGDFLEENDDDITFDVFAQYCIFGKVIYG